LVITGGIAQIFRYGVQGHADIFGKLLSLFACNVIGYCHFHVLYLLVFGRYIFTLNAHNSKSFLRNVSESSMLGAVKVTVIKSSAP
jgi:hypothetical protein